MRPADASYRVVGGEVVPDWLGPQDHPWLRDLLDRAAAAVGRPHGELAARLALPPGSAAPRGRARMAIQVLGASLVAEATALEPDPQALREAVFSAATEARRAGAWDRAAVLAAAAGRVGIPVADLERRWFADLPSERPVAPIVLPDPAGLAARVNEALATSLLHRATTLVLRVNGQARDLVRHLRLRRLLFVARRVEDGLELRVSGPFALFRRTTLYGRAYASVLPRLPWCERFTLEARCAVRDGEATLRLGPRDPVFPCTPPRQFDSALEERFAKDVARGWPDWTVVREPEAVDVGDGLMFPDFALYPTARPDRRYLLEIVGFWTPEYLRAKLDRLARAGGLGWVVCVDERLDAGHGALPDTLVVLPFRRRIDAGAVMERLARLEPIALRVRRDRVGPAACFLDWAGRRPPDHPTHAALAGLSPGQEAGLVERDGACLVVDRAQRPVAALSSREAAIWRPRLPRVRRVEVVEVVERRREQSGAAFRSRLRCESWRVPVVEVTWEP